MVSVFSNYIPDGDVDGGISSVVIIMHITWEGSGLHIPLFTHTELGTDGANPDC